MKIYSLKDDVSGEKSGLDGGEVVSEKLKITELKQGVKNPERVNVFVDEKFSFSLNVAQVVDFHLKVGMELSSEKLAELKKASEFGKLYQRTLEWVLVRPRSVRETRDYLARKLKKSFSDPLLRAPAQGAQSLQSRPVGRENSSKDVFEFSQDIIERLVEKKYLNDKTFAEFYVENRFVKKGISKKRLKLELMKKGISKEIVDEVLDVRNDEEEIEKMIAKKRAKYDDEKLIQYLCRQGFSYDLAREKVAESN